MAKQPLVSCIMPTRDRRAFVPRAVDYFLRQDYQHRELVVVDDGADPVDDLMPSDPRVRYVRLHSRATVGAKRNLACEQARGAVIVHWDDDDWHAPHRLNYQVGALLAAGAELCGITRPLFYDLRDGRAWRYVYPSGRQRWLSGSTLVYTRALWSSRRFPNVDIGEDSQFVAAAPAARMLELPETDFHVGMIHGTNISPKRTGGSCWEPYDVGRIVRLLGDDWDSYQAAPAPGVRGRAARSEALMSTEIAVVMICHEPYLKWLPEARASIDQQLPAFAERIVVFDRCRPSEPAPAGWQYLTGDWRGTAATRNAGLQATRTPWIVFWDADNVMPAGYVAAVVRTVAAAGGDVAILYPDIQLCDEHLAPQQLVVMPPWSYWGLRAENHIDTASAWRREALEVVGGWPDRNGGSFDDYALALDVTAAGWRAARLGGPPILKRRHSGSRGQSSWRNGSSLRNLWRARSTAIVTLLAGRDDVFERWRAFLLQAELPPRAALYVVDNSGRPAFARRAFAVCEQLATMRGLTHLDFATAGKPYQGRASEAYFTRGRHLHVAQLYATVLPRVREDLVLTLEDDVEPPLDALPRLGTEIGFPSHGKIGAVAAAYPMAQHPATVCAGQGDERWGPSIPFARLQPEPIDIGFVGGGCTVWANWVLQELPVNFWWDRGLGWDAALCVQLRRRGYRVRLHGGVRCQHHLHGRIGATPPTETRRSIRRTVVAKTPQPITVPIPAQETREMQLQRHVDSWIEPAAFGRSIPPYLPTYSFDGFASSTHRSLASCRLNAAGLIDLGISGWLRREDALKLYELAYFASGDVLEIGCCFGLSTHILAQAVRDAGGGRTIQTLDINPSAIAHTRSNLAARGLARYVTLRCGNATLVCPELVRLGQRFSFVFVDHAHTYRAVRDVCCSLPDLLADGGLCLFHDYNDGRNQADEHAAYGVAQAVIDTLREPAFEFYGIYGCSALYRCNQLAAQSKQVETNAAAPMSG